MSRVRRTESLKLKLFSSTVCPAKSVIELIPLTTSGHYMYRQFNIQQFYVLPTQCIYVFCVDLRTNSDYFPMQP